MVKRWIEENRVQAVIAITLILCLVIAWMLYSLYGHRLIKDMYEGRTIGVLNKIIQGHDIYPLAYYISQADKVFFGIFIYLCVGVFFIILSFIGKNPLFYGLLIVYTLYCLVFIMKASFLIDGLRYFTLFDDPMISMQYAKNLANGHGLVWNPGGPRVEGYTNFLWVVYMALWHLLSISSAKVSLPIQISGLLFTLGSLFLISKITRDVSGRNGYVSIGAVLLTAAYSPISFWALRGMETSVLGFILLLVTWRIFRVLKRNNFDPFLFIILGVGMLIRIDFAFVFAGIFLFLMCFKSENRKKNLIFASSVFLLFFGGQTLFRWLYYGNIFPNTYYLKMTGIPILLRLQKGLWTDIAFARHMSLVIFSLPFVYCILQRRDKRILFLLYIFLLQFFYSFYVGGDMWGPFMNRYLCIVMPAFLILVSLMVDYLLDKISALRIRTLRTGGDLKRCCFIAIILYIIVQMHGGFGWTFIDNLGSASGMHVDIDKDVVKLALKLKKITTSNCKISVFWAGAIPYFSDRYCIDLLGRNDAVIARQKAKVKTYKDFKPGHCKFDYNYSIGKLKPDIITHAGPWMESYKDYKIIDIMDHEIAWNGHKIAYKEDSSHINWAKLEDILNDIKNRKYLHVDN